MTGGGGGDGDEAPPFPVADNGGEFLLSLLQRHNRQTQSLPHQHPPPPPLQQQSEFPSLTPPFAPLPIQHQQPPLTLDPAVAAIGPSISFAPSPLRQSNGHDLSSPPWPHTLYPRFPSGFPQTPSPPQGSQFQFVEDLQRLGLSSMDARANNTIQHLIQQKQQLEQKLQFGSIPADIRTVNGSNSNLNEAKEWESRNFNAVERNRQFNGHTSSNSQNIGSREQDHMAGLVKQQHGGNYGSPGPRTQPPPGFAGMHRGGGGDLDYMSRGKELDHSLNRDRRNHTEFNNRSSLLSSGNTAEGLGLTEQLDRPGPPAGSKLHTIPGSKKEESLMNPNENGEVLEVGKDDGHEFDDGGVDLVESLLVEGESDGKKEKKQIRNIREKEFRSDNRGQRTLSQRMRILKRQMQCRRDIDRIIIPFLAIYESLIPPEEEKAKQKQLLALLEKLINKEWPDARLYLYGSCANSFGVSKSDIDVCFAISDADINKSEVLLKLADILQSDNLQNVQALTRARVPIVKLMDPVTGISCDVCINNVLAVVNTKLLRDYAEIDVRLRQLAFIVKHWAKSRGVNETYQGTLSSYAYVLMCIHFLQQRRPAILPCLQGMKATYSVNVDGVECAYFDRVGELRGFGSRNRETIAQLVWAFFNYWAYHHDYANDVISVRRGCLISKQEKDWTRRIGNDRHLICIEDPFQISHDLGRVVDKFSIKVLREEFERAADIMQHASNPCVTLFEPYVPAPPIA